MTARAQHGRNPKAVFVLVAAACVLAAPDATARPTALSLAQAVEFTLRSSPELARVGTNVKRREGALQEARGTFNAVLSLASSLEHEEGYLSAQSHADEERRRILLSETAKAFDAVRDQLARQIESKLMGRPVCPGDLDDWIVSVDGERYSTATLCRPLAATDDDIEFTASARSIRDFVNSLFASPVSAGPEETVDSLLVLEEILGMDAQAAAEEVREMAYETVEQNHRLAVEVSSRAALALKRRGVFPEREYQRRLDVSASLTKTFRTGTTFQLEGAIRGIEDNFRDKPLDPKFGGKGLNSVFRSRLGLTLMQPLLRGRGRVAAAAPENAAREDLVAAQELYIHAVTRQVLAVCQAYLQLAAAQETLALLEDVLATQRRVVEGTRTLLRARQVARTELTRLQARATELEARVAQAKVALVAAQTTLAETMGVAGETPGAGLVASQPLPDAPAEIDIDTLSAGARHRRRDLAAAHALRRASQFLLDGARAGTRRRFDLSLQVGMATDYFSPFFRVFKEESIRDIYEPTESPVDYYHPTGFGRSMIDRWQPYVGISITVEVPFENRRAGGRLRQALANHRWSAITAANLSREIDEGVLEQGHTLIRAGHELKLRREAAEHHDQNWANAEGLRSAGEMNLIDTLLTEQRRTAARLELVRAQRDYAMALVEYRLETGTLVEAHDAEPMRINLVGLAGQR